VALLSTGPLPIAGSLVVFLGADIHTSITLEGVAVGSVPLGDILAGIPVEPGDVEGLGVVGHHVADDSVTYVMRNHTCRCGSHTEGTGVTFLAPAGSGCGLLVFWMGGHDKGGNTGQCQREHVVGQHFEGRYVSIDGEKTGDALCSQ
jgi:hypothetical protein